MSNVVIKVENISKQYRLGSTGTGTLSHDLKRWWYLVRGKEDPYQKIGEVNERSKRGESEYVWSLKDICFEVKQGEVLGIIGRNGAGKSTLLKILSKVTGPTEGQVKIKGRIASLLEVGTGFHPELTGRENLFMNGAILGMTKSEIQHKFDEIVNFSGVERYIDTPVKRYSSGMYVRLAFAVAAHLEPEILIVDEVLAVGDIEFQKKCLGKMKDVAGHGRTVLFVSHNMDAINSLCNEAILLDKGRLSKKGKSDEVIREYLDIRTMGYSYIKVDDHQMLQRHGRKKAGEIESIGLYDQFGKPTNAIFLGDDLIIRIKVRINQEVNNPEVGLCFSNSREVRLQHIVSRWDKEFGHLGKGVHEFTVRISHVNLYPGTYPISVWFRGHSKENTDDFINSVLALEVIKSKKYEQINFSDFQTHGGVLASFSWDKIQ